MSLPNRLSAHFFLNPLVGAAFLHDVGAAVPAGLELIGPAGEKFRTTEAVKFVGGGPVEIPLEAVGWLRDQVRHATELFSRLRPNREAVISRMPTQRGHESNFLAPWLVPLEIVKAYKDAHDAKLADRFREYILGPAPYKRYMALSFVDDAFNDAIFTGSQAVAEKLPAWEANARVVLAGAKRWAQQRWGRS